MIFQLVAVVLFSSLALAILPVLTPTGKCVPGELVWVECNLCTCNPQGRPNAVCAYMWCQPVPKVLFENTPRPPTTAAPPDEGEDGQADNKTRPIVDFDSAEINKVDDDDSGYSLPPSSKDRIYDFIMDNRNRVQIDDFNETSPFV